MTKYIVSPSDFYRGIGNFIETSSNNTLFGATEVFLTKDAMNGLIERYSLSGKSILSVGAGAAFEEYWFYKAGCTLVLNDLDLPSHEIESFLIELPQAEKGLEYWIDDADRTLRELQDGSFDVVYVSSFHPDEVRRECIQEQFKRSRTPHESYHYVTWPNDAKPYADTLISSTSKTKHSGLVIFQHYKGGVSLQSNPHYLSSMINQFEQNGVTLLEVFSFQQSSQHLLVIGFKGSLQLARYYASTYLLNKQAIKTFHGRYSEIAVKNNVVKVYDILNPHVNINSAYPKQDDLAKPPKNNFIKRLISKFPIK